MKTIIFRWIKIIALVYGIVGIALFYLQDKILFHPTPLEKDFNYGFGPYATDVTIPYDKTTSLNIIQFKPGGDTVPKGVVLYFHGNRKNISWYEKYARRFTKNGYEIWMMDYPGFGKSTGEFTEQALYDYALQFYKLARRKYQPDSIVIYGKSLGTCVASQLASVRDCKYLVMETPCYSMVSLISHYLPFYPVNRLLHYHFPTNEYLEKVTAPIIIFHGTDDGIIPYSNAKRLASLLHQHDEFITIAGGSHNDLPGFPLFRQKLDSLLSN